MWISLNTRGRTLLSETMLWLHLCHTWSRLISVYHRRPSWVRSRQLRRTAKEKGSEKERCVASFLFLLLTLSFFLFSSFWLVFCLEEGRLILDSTLRNAQIGAKEVNAAEQNETDCRHFSARTTRFNGTRPFFKYYFWI